MLEDLSKEGIRVIMNNTDGTTCIVPKDKLNIYHKINKDIEKEFLVAWEYAVIDKIFVKNVNNYHATISKEYMIDDDLSEINVKEKAKIKRKGLFKLEFDENGNREIPLGDSVDQLIIAKCLNLYYTKNITPEEVINNPEKYDLHIYDFCKANKINKDYEVFHNNEKQQQLNRYYFSKNAPYLYKRKRGKQTMENVNVGLGVKLFNVYEDKPWEEYDIHKAYYISEVKKIITEINNQNQLKFLF